jgi:DNA-binding NarL/FixJ family response regulator
VTPVPPSTVLAEAQTAPALSVVVGGDGSAVAARVLAALRVDGIVGEAAPARVADVVARARRLHCDAVILCCDLSLLSDMTILRHVRKELPEAGIVVVAVGSRGRTGTTEAFNVGADGLLLESELEQSLTHVVRSVAAGYLSVPRGLRRVVVRPAFSHRERQVLALMATGLQNRVIADRLFLAESTVKSHLTSSFEKLGVHSRKEAAALLMDPVEGLRGLILDDEPDPGAASA